MIIDFCTQCYSGRAQLELWNKDRDDDIPIVPLGPARSPQEARERAAAWLRELADKVEGVSRGEYPGWNDR